MLRVWLAVAGLLLPLVVYAQVGALDALRQAERHLERALQAQGMERQRQIEQARRALSSLPTPVREPIERSLGRARLNDRPTALQDALREIETLRRTLESRASIPAPDQVRAQLRAIFAEPDMQPPPKSLVERVFESIGRALENLLRRIERLLRGLGGGGSGSWGVVVQWIVIALLVLLIAFSASYLIGRMEWRRARREVPMLAVEEMVDARLLSSAEWRALAHQLRMQGDLRAAVRALYLGLLRLLHEARLLDYDPARTNWEHLMSLRAPTSPQSAVREQAFELLRPLTLRFDYLWYGNEGATERDVQQFEEAFERLRGMIPSDAKRVA
jgi:hypothetical protein